MRVFYQFRKPFYTGTTFIKEGDMGVYGIAVLGFFSCGISVILILTCCIAVSSTILITNRWNRSHLSLEFSPNFLHSLLTSSFSLKFAPLLPQCWATRILDQWDDCNTQINIGEGENHTSVSRFVTRIVALQYAVFHHFGWRYSVK